MLRQVDWASDGAYRSGTDREPIEFYLNALCHSTNLDLLLGYFSSAAIHVLSLGFASFLHAGGRMRAVINDVLSAEDKEAILKGNRGEIPPGIIDLKNIHQLRRVLDDYDRHFFECLAWLIANGRIDIVVVKPKDKKGIAHYKSGIFRDADNAVGFKASCNFTAYGLLENLEELDVFLSWEDGRAGKMVAGQQRVFEDLFSGKADYVDYLPVEDVIVAVEANFGNKPLEDLLLQEQQLVQQRRLRPEKGPLKQVLEQLAARLEEQAREPRFPYPEGPREYQVTAYENWAKNGFQGVFAMATGTGKTITALNCLLTIYRQTGNYKAIILVPTTALLEQWKKECAKFNFKNIITVSSKENWNENLAFYSTAGRLIPTNFIVIVTYASMIRAKFQSHFTQLPEDTVLIADEAHNLGAPGLVKLLPTIHLPRRIGLSATPIRQYDSEGNSSIEEFFHDKMPYVYSFSMKKALDMGWLCHYTYYPHLVQLTEAETAEYLRISRLLMRFFDPKTGKYKESKEVDDLLLKRKRVIHKAVNKKKALKEILNGELKSRGNLKYCLIYVPEGVESEFADVDQANESQEERSLIDEYTTIVKESDDEVMVKQFTAETPNRNELIQQFERGTVHVLTSMKCLDEGVDVPRAELAIFCASTGNPRQFIQRRGRVLRQHKDKVNAVIHDLVVAPKISASEGSYEMEKNLLRKELERVVDFSGLAFNKIDTYNALRGVLDYYNLNLNDFATEKMK